jgi:SAM-dependent methyltransferase
VPSALLSTVGRLPFVRKLGQFVDLAGSLHVEGIERIAHHARGRMLDVGCGEKPYQYIFAPHVSEHVGVEYSESFAETHASQREGATASGTGPDVYYDGKRLPFEDASFDTVLSTQVLEHTSEPGALMAEMARVLRPGGKLLLTVPFSFRLHEEPRDFFRYTPHGLRALCEAADMRVLECAPFGSVWTAIAHKVNSLLTLRVVRLQGLGQAVGKFGHEREATRGPRWALVPFAVPAMVTLAAVGRVMDRVLDDPTEAIGYVVVAERARQ